MGRKIDPRLCISWPPDFKRAYTRRVELLDTLRNDPVARAAVLRHYETNPVDFILDWCTTYDPRNAGTDLPTTMPFCLFPRQAELVEFLSGCLTDKENGLIEKCRDAGATFVCCAFSVWAWRFKPGASVGWGSRKEQLVDKLGDPDSIFEKMRAMITLLPADIFHPKGFKPKEHMAYMKIVNPENGSTISGEAGDNIGRGGRKTIYFKDESAHYERPELIEASLGDNTDVQIDISSVNGTGNVFYRNRKSGVEWRPNGKLPRKQTRVFIFDWRHHPNKTQEWYDNRRADAERKGLLHVFAQEVDRDYSSAVEGVVIPSAWVNACIDAHVACRWSEPSGVLTAGMDVADGGGDLNSMSVIHGYLLMSNTATGGESDVIGRQYYMLADMLGVKQWRYEVTGVGTGARSGAKAYRYTCEESGRKPASLPAIQGWDPASGVANPQCDISTGERVEPGDKEARRNRDHFANLKAQAWWHLRKLCHNTYKVRFEGADISPDDCFSIPSTLPDREEIVNELSQPTYTTNGAGKIVIDKKPNGTASPNRADSIVIAKSPMRLIDNEQAHPGGAGVDTPDHVAIG